MKPIIDGLKRQIDALLIEFPELAEDEELRADVLEGQTDLDWIMGKIIDNDADARGMAGAIGDRINELKERKSRYTRKSDFYRALAQGILERAELKKLELPLATVSLRNVPPSVIVDDETKLPDRCIRTKREPDKTAIKGLLTDGLEVPGAHLTNGSVSVSIRTK